MRRLMHRGRHDADGRRMPHRREPSEDRGDPDGGRRAAGSSAHGAHGELRRAGRSGDPPRRGRGRPRRHRRGLRDLAPRQTLWPRVRPPPCTSSRTTPCARTSYPWTSSSSLCRAHGVPAIVDMASEYDLTGPVALGASAEIYSGHKFLSGVTSGIIAGASDLIRATYLQHRGIGRTMKAGKESVVGAMAALEVWERRDHAAARRAEEARVDALDARARGYPRPSPLRAHADWTGNPITRVRIARLRSSRVPDSMPGTLADRLAARTPRIMVRDDLIERQEIYLDPCNLTDEEAAAVAAAIREEAERLRVDGDGCRESWSDIKRMRARLRSWPGRGTAMLLDGKRILITGAARGIGLAVSRSVPRRGRPRVAHGCGCRGPGRRRQTG